MPLPNEAMCAAVCALVHVLRAGLSVCQPSAGADRYGQPAHRGTRCGDPLRADRRPGLARRSADAKHGIAVASCRSAATGAGPRRLCSGAASHPSFSSPPSGLGGLHDAIAGTRQVRLGPRCVSSGLAMEPSTDSVGGLPPSVAPARRGWSLEPVRRHLHGAALPSRM